MLSPGDVNKKRTFEHSPTEPPFKYAKTVEHQLDYEFKLLSSSVINGDRACVKKIPQTLKFNGEFKALNQPIPNQIKAELVFFPPGQPLVNCVMCNETELEDEKYRVCFTIDESRITSLKEAISGYLRNHAKSYDPIALWCSGRWRNLTRSDEQFTLLLPALLYINGKPLNQWFWIKFTEGEGETHAEKSTSLSSVLPTEEGYYEIHWKIPFRTSTMQNPIVPISSLPQRTYVPPPPPRPSIPSNYTNSPTNRPSFSSNNNYHYHYLTAQTINRVPSQILPIMNKPIIDLTISPSSSIPPPPPPPTVLISTVTEVITPMIDVKPEPTRHEDVTSSSVVTSPVINSPAIYPLSISVHPAPVRNNNNNLETTAVQTLSSQFLPSLESKLDLSPFSFYPLPPIEKKDWLGAYAEPNRGPLLNSTPNQGVILSYPHELSEQAPVYLIPNGLPGGFSGYPPAPTGVMDNEEWYEFFTKPTIFDRRETRSQGKQDIRQLTVCVNNETVNVKVAVVSGKVNSNQGRREYVSKLRDYVRLSPESKNWCLEISKRTGGGPGSGIRPLQLQYWTDDKLPSLRLKANIGYTMMIRIKKRLNQIYKKEDYKLNTFDIKFLTNADQPSIELDNIPSLVSDPPTGTLLTT